MKLTSKLILAILAVMILVFLVNAGVRVVESRANVRRQVAEHDKVLGQVLANALVAVWQREGEGSALAMLQKAAVGGSDLRLSWLWIGPTLAVVRPPLEHDDLRALRQGKTEQIVVERDSQDLVYTYVPLTLTDGRQGALELSESTEGEREQALAGIVQTTSSRLTIAAGAALLMSLLGNLLVGRPVRALAAKARRVGAGDLSGPLELNLRDELGDLAHEMNAMCERLADETLARQQALEQLRHAERLATVGQLAAGVAHELGTPLSVVTLEAKRIKNGKAEHQAARETAAVIVEQAERMAQIIHQLLDFARRRAPRAAPCDLAELAAQTLPMLEVLAERAGVRLKLQPLSRAPAAVDTNQLQQVLTNLTVNAIHAMPHGGEITFETGTAEPPGRGAATGASTRKEAMVYLRVIDQGVGIAPEIRHRIFEPFFTTKDVGQGTGLGLPVAHGIVEDHSGFIEVDSEPGQGATFTVWLPRTEET